VTSPYKGVLALEMLVLLPSFRTKEGAAAQALLNCQQDYALAPSFMQHLYVALIIFRLCTLRNIFTVNSFTQIHECCFI
jgi:hypothetical protein